MIFLNLVDYFHQYSSKFHGILRIFVTKIKLNTQTCGLNVYIYFNIQVPDPYVHIDQYLNIAVRADDQHIT